MPRINWRSALLRAQVALGLRTWGRQEPPIKLHITTRARVLRASGEVEDLGVVDEREV